MPFQTGNTEAVGRGRPLDIKKAWSDLGVIGQARMLADIYESALNGDRVAAGLIRGYAKAFKRQKEV